MQATLLFLFLGGLTNPCWRQLSAQDTQASQPPVSELQQALVGAWVYTGPPGNTLEPKPDAEMKFWGLAHFAVTKRDTATNKVVYHHIGTYTLDGDQYSETVTFAIGSTERLIGETFKFRIEVDGDTYIQHGVGNPWTQQWKRLRQAEPKSADTKPSEVESDKQFAVPEQASNDELFAFMDRVRAIPPVKRDMVNVRKHASQVFGAIIAAADIVIDRGDSQDDTVNAITKKFDALSMLVNYDSSVKPQLQQLIDQYSEDDRPQVAAVALGQSLRSKTAKLRQATPAEAREISDEVLSYVERFGASKSTYAAIVSVASSLGYSDQKEAAADLHEKLSPFFRDSADEAVQRYADRMLGTARRLRLLGQEMPLHGTTANGDDFQWEDYRGKVVLVDFWASWCGPCLSEIPNMKKNLEQYADKGFAIVGINMDSTRTAFEKCVKQHDISWVNIVSEEPGLTGWDAPLATYYGVSGIPTAILVDQHGKVVSLQARGRELDRQLESLLGKVSQKAEKAEDE